MSKQATEREASAMSTQPRCWHGETKQHIVRNRELTTCPGPTAATEGVSIVRYANIVFLQGEEGREVTDALFNVEGVVAHGVTAESVTAAVEYLSQWNYGDEPTELRDELPAGSDDLVVFADGGEYVLTANLGMGYVGLSLIVKDGE